MSDTYALRRNVSPSRSSSVRKLIRGKRIDAGQRPDAMKRLYTVAEFAGLPPGSPWQHHAMLAFIARRHGLKSPTKGTFARLHPTKGFRFGAAI